MPQPARNTELAEQLIKVYRDAQDRLIAEYQAVVDEPSRARQARRLRELIATNDAVIDGLIEASKAWYTLTLAELHAAGARAAADAVGSAFTWTQAHSEAVEQFAARGWDDVAARLQDMRAETRRVLRRQAADATRSALLENRTATQAGRELAREAAGQGLFAVRYANGARHTVADWADSTIRTTTAEAYNRGTLTQCVGDRIEHVEYFDGEGCCVGPGHKVGPPANGLVVALDEVVTLSHPRCRRALGPRPDVADPSKARPTPPSFVEGPALAPEPQTVAGRSPRTPRAPRTARNG